MSTECAAKCKPEIDPLIYLLSWILLPKFSLPFLSWRTLRQLLQSCFTSQTRLLQLVTRTGNWPPHIYREGVGRERWPLHFLCAAVASSCGIWEECRQLPQSFAPGNARTATDPLVSTPVNSPVLLKSTKIAMHNKPHLVSFCSLGFTSLVADPYQTCLYANCMDSVWVTRMTDVQNGCLYCLLKFQRIHWVAQFNKISP